MRLPKVLHNSDRVFVVRYSRALWTRLRMPSSWWIGLGHVRGGRSRLVVWLRVCGIEATLWPLGAS